MKLCLCFISAALAHFVLKLFLHMSFICNALAIGNSWENSTYLHMVQLSSKVTFARVWDASVQAQNLGVSATPFFARRGTHPERMRDTSEMRTGCMCESYFGVELYRNYLRWANSYPWTYIHKAKDHLLLEHNSMQVIAILNSSDCKHAQSVKFCIIKINSNGHRSNTKWTYRCMQWNYLALY